MPNTIFIDFLGSNQGLSGPILASNGAVGAPSHSFALDPTSGMYIASAGDVRVAISGADLVRLTAGILALRNGANPMAEQVYKTDDGAGNTEFIEIKWSGNQGLIQTNKTGTGTIREMAIATFGNGNVRLEVQGATATSWFVEGITGKWLAGADNTLDIGAAAANRPATIYAGTRVVAPAYTVGATAGANFGPSAVASLTVVNGIVTAAS